MAARTTTSKAPGSKRHKKPNVKSVRIATDAEFAEEYEEAKAALDRIEARLRARPEDVVLLAQRDQAWERLEMAEAALKENSTKFTFRALGHKSYEKLVSEHPVTEEHRAEIEAAGGTMDSFPWNPKTFPIALIARSLVDEDDEFGTEEEIIEWIDGDEWNSAELNALFTAALEANTSRKVVQLGNGSRPIPR